jgi:hypothetical protein
VATPDPGSGQPGGCAFADQVAFELGQSGEDVEDELAAGGGGVDCLLQAAESDPTVGQAGDSPRLPSRRAISRSDSPCRQRAQTSSCSAADSPQDRTDHLHRRQIRQCGGDATTH